MKTRILTALVLFPPAIYVLGWSPLWLFAAVAAVVAMLALREYFEICGLSGQKTYVVVGYALLAIQFASAFALRYVGGQSTLSISQGLAGVLVFLAPFVVLFQRGDSTHAWAAIWKTWLGFIYVGLPLALLVLIRFGDVVAGFHWIFFLFIVIWAGDIFAYFVGRATGRHLLAPRISPKKTWEGAVAGLAGSIAVAGAYAHWVWKAPNLTALLILAGSIAVAGQVGDLVESALKRKANLKDSGSILPGHGGILDRIDALLFGSAALWLALSLKELGIW